MEDQNTVETLQFGDIVAKEVGTAQSLQVVEEPQHAQNKSTVPADEGSESFVSAVGDMSDHPFESYFDGVGLVSTTISSGPCNKTAAELTATVTIPVMAQILVEEESEGQPDDSIVVLDPATPSNIGTIENQITTMASVKDSNLKLMEDPLKYGSSKRGRMMGRLGKMLSERRLNFGTDADGGNECASIDKVIECEEVKEPCPSIGSDDTLPKRSFIDRLGKMLSDRRLHFTDKDDDTAAPFSCESEDVVFDFMDGPDDVERNQSEECSTLKNQPRQSTLPTLRASKPNEIENPASESNEADGQKVDSGEVVDDNNVEEEVGNRRGLMKRIGSYVKEKELLKTLSIRNLLRSLSKGDLKLADDLGYADLSDEGVDHGEKDQDAAEEVKQAVESNVGVFSRIGKIIAERRAHSTSEVSGSHETNNLQPDKACDEMNKNAAVNHMEQTPSTVGASTHTTGRRSFLQGLRDIVSTRSIGKSDVRPTYDGTVDSPLEGKMVHDKSCQELSNDSGIEANVTAKKILRTNLLARINSFLIRYSVLDNDSKSTEWLPIDTKELDALMKRQGVPFSENEIKSGLALVDAELEKDNLPKNRQEYLLTLQTYLLEQQLDQAKRAFEAPGL